MTPHGRIGVLLADDQEDIRSGFRFFLDSQPDIALVGEASNGVEAVTMATELRPDVCLFDIRMPLLDGIEATRRLAGPTVSDPLHVVVVTTFDTDEYVYSALEAGACGFLLKDAGPTLLAEAVRAAARGDSLVSPSITVRLLQRLAAPAQPPPAPGSQPDGAPPARVLTNRELDVVKLVAHGSTNDEIARSLHVSLSTVKTHLASIQLKLNVRNRVETAAWAWRSGLATPWPTND